MTVRGGIVAGGWGHRTAARSPAKAVDPTSPIGTILEAQSIPVPWLRLFGVVLVVAAFVAVIPGRTAIPPLLESDYCYLLTAADRLHDGLGLTATPPVAPFQPWEWQGDWAFLTQWPIGYPLLIAATRSVLGVGTIDACRWISVLACAASLVGWFVWIRRCVPRGGTGVLVACVAAGGSVSAASLINPSTDAILVAAVPFVLLLAGDCLRRSAMLHERSRPQRTTGAWSFGVLGIAAGGLFWIRYAAIFVPMSIGACLVGMWFVSRSRRARPTGTTAPACADEKLSHSRPSDGGALPRITITVRQVAWFAFGAALPIGSLLLVNRALGQPQPIQAQLNLGGNLAVDFTWRHMATAWTRWTDLGFYDYHAGARIVYAIWPLGLIAACLLLRRTRRVGMSFFSTPAVLFSVTTVVTGLAMLIAVTAVFGGKYDFVNLERYYTPIKPLYFALFAAPVLLIPRRTVRAVAAIALIVGCSWIVQQEWARTYRRWHQADRPVASSGAWAREFGSEAIELYDCLRAQDGSDLVVVSNFHEYIAFETGIAALPIPPNPAVLRRWVSQIGAERGVDRLRVLFALDPDNGDRAYWITDPQQIAQDFDLRPVKVEPASLTGRLFEFRLGTPSAGDGRT